MGMTPAQFAAKIKAQYPQYKDIPDLDLTNKIIAKYPTYKSQVNMPEQPGLLARGWDALNKPLVSPQTVLKGIGQTPQGVEAGIKAREEAPTLTPYPGWLRGAISIPGAEKFGAEMVSGLTSPLNLGLTALGGAGAIRGAVSAPIEEEVGNLGRILARFQAAKSPEEASFIKSEIAAARAKLGETQFWRGLEHLGFGGLGASQAVEGGKDLLHAKSGPSALKDIAQIGMGAAAMGGLGGGKTPEIPPPSTEAGIEGSLQNWFAHQKTIENMAQKALPRGPIMPQDMTNITAGSQPTGPYNPAYHVTPQPEGAYLGSPDPTHAEYGPIPVRPQTPPNPQRPLGLEPAHPLRMAQQGIERSAKQFTDTPIPGAKPPKTMAPQVIPTGTSRGGVGGPPRTETPQPSGKLQQNVRPQTPEIQAQIEQHDQLLKRMLAVKPLRNSPGFPEWNQLFQQVRAARDQLISGTGKPTPTPPPPSVDPGLEKANERVAQPAGTTGAQEAQLRQAKTGVVTPKPVVPDQGPPPVSPRVTGPPRPSAPGVVEEPKEPKSVLAAPKVQAPQALAPPQTPSPLPMGETPAKPEVPAQTPVQAQAGAKAAERVVPQAPPPVTTPTTPKPQLSELEQLKQQMIKEGTLSTTPTIPEEFAKTKRVDRSGPTPKQVAEANKGLGEPRPAPKPALKSAAGPGVGLEQGPSKVSKRLGPGPQGTRTGKYGEEGFAQLPLPDLEKVEHYVKGSLVEPTKEGIAKGQAALKFVRNTLAPGSAAKPSILDDFFEMKGLREQKLSEAGKKFPMHESYRGTTLERLNKVINHSEKVMSNLDDYWARQPEGDRWDFIHRIETGQKQADLVNQKIADFYKGMYDEVYKARKQLDPTAAYRKNYWRTPWDREGTGQNAGLYQGKPLKGPQSYLNPKTYATTAAGKAAGLKPMTSNPNEMFKVNLSEQYRGLTAERFLQAGVKNGYVKEIPVGKSLPAGFERLKDPYPKPYAVTSDAARIINNYLSRSLYSNTTFRTAMGLKTAMTGIELFGPFHALTTTGHAISSDFMMGTRRFWNEGLRQMSPGEAIKGLKDMSKSLGTPVRAAMEGSKLKKWFNNPEEFIHDQGIRGLVNTYPEIKNMIGDLFLAGGKLGVDEEFKLNQLKQMRDAWTRGNIPMAAIRVPLVAIQAAMKPLFEHYIPNIKIGLWLKEYAAAIRENDAKLASGEVSRATLARDSWANTENMFGELNHDNLMWNRAMKGALQLLYRSVSWRFGNIRLVGSAFRDSFMSLRQSVKLAGDLMTGKTPVSAKTIAQAALPEIPASLAHAFGSVLATAVVAEIVQYGLTGKHLSSGMDVVRPQTGGLDDRGKPIRHTLPFYGSRDFPEMFQMFGAGSKSQSVLAGLGYFTGGTSAFVQRIFDTINNKDFTGGQVYDPHANPAKQALQIGEHMIPPPIAVQNLSTARKNESTLEKFLEGTVFGKASRRFENTDAENYFLGRKVASIPAEGRDKASVVRADTERELLTYLRNNDKQGFLTEARAAAKARILTPNQIRGVVRQSRQSYLANLAERATAPDLLEGFQKSTPEEQKQLLPVMARTLRRSTTTPEQRTQILQLLRQRNFHTETEQSFGEPVEPESSSLPPLTPEPH